MKKLKEYYNLKDRDTFYVDVVNNVEDAKYFFGNILSEDGENQPVNKVILKLIERARLGIGVPKIYIYGEYGSGKTHMLYHIKYNLEADEDNEFIIKIIKLEIARNTKYQYLHEKIMNSFGPDEIKRLLDKFFYDCIGDDNKIKSFFQDESLETVARMLSVSPQASPNKILAWRWLCGESLSSGDLQKLSIAKNIDENKTLVDILCKIGSLYKKEEKKILLLIDEAEKLRDIGVEDAKTSFSNAFRELAEPENNSIGFIVSIYATTQDDIPEFISRREIVGRPGMEVKNLPYLAQISDIKAFIKDLLDNFIDKDKAKKEIEKDKLKVDIDFYPFTDAAIEAISDKATMDATKSTPRRIIRCIQESAVTAIMDDTKPITDDITDSVSRSIFQ